MIITTSRGFTVEVTPHHPLYTFAKDGYMGMRHTDELFEGDGWGESQDENGYI